MFLSVSMASSKDTADCKQLNTLKKTLWPTIKEMVNFETVNDQDVLDAMKDAFWKIQENMREEAADWPRGESGHPSPSGTTCSCALICNERLYIAHVGNSRIILVGKTGAYVQLTTDHKPDLVDEETRILEAGGSVSNTSSVTRVYWTCARQRNNKTEHYETRAVLATSRSLGDYWSYNEISQKYIVSPEPQCLVHVIDKNEDRVLVFVSNGIAHVLSSEEIAEKIHGYRDEIPRNLARLLLRDACRRYGALQRDNMSVISVGFHNDYDMTFPSELRLLVDRPIIKHLIDYPQDIVRVYPHRVCSTTPEDDGLNFDRSSPLSVRFQLVPASTDTSSPLRRSAPSNNDIVNLTPLVCCPEKDQAAVRRVKSDRCTIAGHYYALSQESMPGTSQMGSSGPRIDIYDLSELRATISGYTTPKERTPTSDEDSRMVDILCTPLRKKTSTAVATFFLHLVSQQNAPKKRRFLDER
ncbi:Protein phosphatase 1D [Aphelenchoides besseyi]|nr:Protein phosphatase 1D [Aphelenchoides besseyi]